MRVGGARHQILLATEHKLKTSPHLYMFRVTGV